MVLDELAAAQMVSQCLKLLEKFAWLLDCYVLDFFVDDHWSKIPRLWQETLRVCFIQHMCAEICNIQLHVWIFKIKLLFQSTVM